MAESVANSILITGASGFIGSHLVKQLRQKGVKVLTPDFDITKFEDVQKYANSVEPSPAILHLAGMSFVPDCEKNPEQAMLVNYQGTINLRIAFPKAQKFIFMSTGQIYEANNSGQALSESAPISEAGNTYAKSKIKAENFLLDRNVKVGERNTVLRLFNHTHRTQPSNFFLPRMLMQMEAMLKKGDIAGDIVTGNLDLVRDLGAIQDLTRALELLLTKPVAQEIYNLCSGHGKRLRTLVITLASHLGLKPHLVLNPELVRVEPEAIVGDNSRFRADFGWIPQANDEESLVKLFLASTV